MDNWQQYHKPNNAHQPGRDIKDFHRDRTGKTFEDYHRTQNQFNNSNSGSFLRDFFMHWPIQEKETVAQKIAGTKGDDLESNVALSDVHFRWLGFSNLYTIFISILSLVGASLVFIITIFYSGNMLVAYVFLVFILMHSLFPGYIITRIKKFEGGSGKTKKYISILRRSWFWFEALYVIYALGLLYFRNFIDWVNLKVSIEDYFLSRKITEKFLYPIMEKIPIEQMSKALEFLSLGLLVVFLFYITMLYLTNKTAREERIKFRDSINKEYKRPAEMAMEKMRRKRDA